MIAAPLAARAASSNKTLIKKIIGLAAVLLVAVLVVVIVLSVLKTFGASGGDPGEVRKNEVRVLTNNGAEGPSGPSKLKYRGKLLHEVKVSRQYPGIQLWTVPTSGIWSIEARGASGADGILVGGSVNRKRGGFGAVVKGKFVLEKGKILKVLIGQEGSRDPVAAHRPGAGGGGTFVIYEDGKPLLVAGGGGGGGIPKATSQTHGGGGRVNDAPVSSVSGSEGFGGKLVDTSHGDNTAIEEPMGHHNVIAGAGGGLYGSGVGLYKDWGGNSFVDGGIGGRAVPKYEVFEHGTMGEGGFGGGGAAGLLPGGGGGYSGGGVKGCWLECNGKEGGTAEGGSSLNNGMSPSNTPNRNKGHGKVYIRLLSADSEEASSTTALF